MMKRLDFCAEAQQPTNNQIQTHCAPLTTIKLTTIAITIQTLIIHAYHQFQAQGSQAIIHSRSTTLEICLRLKIKNHNINIKTLKNASVLFLMLTYTANQPNTALGIAYHSCSNPLSQPPTTLSRFNRRCTTEQIQHHTISQSVNQNQIQLLSPSFN